MSNDTAMKSETTYLYSISTELVDPDSDRSDTLFSFAQGLGGLEHIEVMETGVLWLYDSLNNAKIARNVLESAGFTCGANICRFVVDGSLITFEESLDA